MRNVTDSGLDLLIEFEGFRSKAYRDVAGIWTIGYGTIRIHGRPVRPTDVCTQQEARRFMVEDLRRFCEAVDVVLPADATQDQFNALVVMAYNIGVGGFKSSTIYRKLQSRTPLTESNFTVWNKSRVDGELVVVPGLTRRRLAEYRLYNSGT